MARGRKQSSDPDKNKKKVYIELIKREHAGKKVYPYRLLDVLIEQFHSHLDAKRIALLWNKGPAREDVDGRRVLRNVKKCSDADREFAPYDIRITLHHDTWNNAAFDQDKQAALLDGALTMIAVVKDKNGEDKEDTRGRTVYRIRRAPSEFPEVVARHGMWNPELAKIAQCEAAYNDRPANRPLFRTIGDNEMMLADGTKRKDTPETETKAADKPAEGDLLPIHGKPKGRKKPAAGKKKTGRSQFASQKTKRTAKGGGGGGNGNGHKRHAASPHK